MNIRNIKEIYVAYIIALLIPSLGGILSIVLYKRKYAKNLFWLWCTYMGSIFIFDPMGGSESDCVRYAAWLYEMYASNIGFYDFCKVLYSEGGNTDIYQPLLTFLVSRFTNNAHILFLVFAVIFGYFYSRNVWFLIENAVAHKNKYIFLLIVAFALICPIWLINGVRMWTAFHIFLYGLLPYLLFRKYSKLLWCCLAVFVHFSYMIPLVILLLFMLLPIHNNILLIAYLVTQVISEVNITAINLILIKIMPSELFVSKVNGYVNEEYSIRVNSAYNAMSSYVRIFDQIMKWSMVFINLIIFMIFKGNSYISCRYKHIYYFVLFFGAIAALISNIPSGGRFMLISYSITLFLFLLLYKIVENSRYRKYYKYLSILLIPFILIQIRQSFYFYGFDVFFQNIITSYWLENNFTIDYYLSFFK